MLKQSLEQGEGSPGVWSRSCSYLRLGFGFLPNSLLPETSLFKSWLSGSLRFCWVQHFRKWRCHLPALPPKRRLNNPGGFTSGFLRTLFAFSSSRSPRDSNRSPRPAGLRAKVSISVSKDLIVNLRITRGKCHTWCVTPNSHKSLLCGNIKSYHVSTMELLKMRIIFKAILRSYFYRMKRIQEVYFIKILISIRKYILRSALRPREGLSFLYIKITHIWELYISAYTCKEHIHKHIQYFAHIYAITEYFHGIKSWRNSSEANCIFSINKCNMVQWHCTQYVLLQYQEQYFQ